MQDNNLNRKELLAQKVIFCTECGAELQNFCIDDRADDPEAIKRTLQQCKKIGRFNGEFCSKLFIAGNDNLENLFTNDK